MPTLDQIERISTVTKGMETCNRAIILRIQDRNQWYNLNLHLLEFRIIYEMIQILKIKRHK